MTHPNTLMFVLLALAWVFCCIDVSAQQSMNYELTETLVSEYIGNNGDAGELFYGDDDDFFMFRNLLQIRGSSRLFNTGLRTDATLFQNPPGHVPGDEFAMHPGGSGYTTLDFGNDVRVERIHGTVRLGALQLTAGDFYVNFGRGMALSLIKQSDAGVDNTLRGGRLEYSQRDAFKFILVGGVVNALNVDPVTHQIWRDDPLDRILGGRLEWSRARPLTLFAHGVHMVPRFDNEAAVDPERNFIDQGAGVGVTTGGGGTELFAGDAHLYLEGNAQTHNNYRPMGADRDVLGESGYAAFGEISYDFSPFSLKAEGIFYRRWLMEGPYRGSSPSISVLGAPTPYHHLVTLEPKWMTINSLGNAEGGRLSGDWYFPSTHMSLTLMTSGIVYERGLTPNGTWDDLHPRTAIVHPLLRLSKRFEGSAVEFSLEGGYRREWALTEMPGHADSGMLWHGLADLTVPIKGPHSVELRSEVRRHELSVSEFNHHWITFTSIQYSIAGRFDIAAMHEFSDETPGGEIALGNWVLPLPTNHYASGLIGFHAPRPLDGMSLKLTGGAQRGGIKCVGGVCREYPESVGVRLEAVYRF